ncbi:S41 family peptidase [Polaribacter sp. MSW13]|uniref:S41 family peptidase n=1 Tax=Polaribacter marinus TaxID=2916838 RepID=A0A9X1VLR2_9FLAO|nr:S41 family peptidase [Polaribacter marinus]MCI2228486.1 S41 family peptidase [Polaribacter marinus]
MRNFLKLISLSLFISIFTSCSKEYEVPQDLIVHDFVWKGLNAYYLHQDQIEDLSDLRFHSDEQLNSYLSSFPDYQTLFSSLLVSGDTKSTLIEDYNTIEENSVLRTDFTNGVEFGIIAEPGSSDNVLAYVTHILPNSDASSKNILRGEYFYAVDGVQLTRANYQNILLNGSDNFTLNMANFNGTIVTPNAKTVALEKQNYTYEPIFLDKIITIGADNIGYLMYNNDFSKIYINNLNNTFLSFKNQFVNKLIIDLRYNIGGGSFAKNISQIANMITGEFPDEVLIKEEWNSKSQSWFLANQPDSLITKFSDKLNANTNFNSLKIKDLYIILNGENFSGSSAVELLVNSLSPYINVHLIGNQTSGNNTGSITLYNSNDYDFGLRNMTHTVALQPIVLNFLNKDNQTYENGFTPNINLCSNEDVINLGVLGETSDPILNRVLNYVSSGNTGISPICNPNSFDYLFNSISPKREIDNGVFIKQNLPNTY